MTQFLVETWATFPRGRCEHSTGCAGDSIYRVVYHAGIAILERSLVWIGHEAGHSAENPRQAMVRNGARTPVGEAGVHDNDHQFRWGVMEMSSKPAGFQHMNSGAHKHSVHNILLWHRTKLCITNLGQNVGRSCHLLVTPNDHFWVIYNSASGARLLVAYESLWHHQPGFLL